MNEYDGWRSAGQLNLDTFAALLLRLSGQVARTKTYPWPEDHEGWTEAAVQQLANKVYERKKGKVMGLKIFQKATGQPSLERLLLATIENVLIDEAKHTETGKLRRRLITVLGEDSRFARVTQPEECWALTGGPQAMWQGDRDVLVQAALKIQGYAVWTWNTAGPTPLPVKTALKEVSFGVLDEAKGAVRDQELALVLRTRFVHIAPLNASSLTALHADAAPLTGSDDPADVVVLEINVDAIWETLSPTEQCVVAHIGENPAEWARSCSLRPRQAAAVEAALVEKLKAAVVGEERARELVLELRGRSIESGLGPPEISRLLMTDRNGDSGGEGYV